MLSPFQTINKNSLQNILFSESSVNTKLKSTKNKKFLQNKLFYITDQTDRGRDDNIIK